MLVDLKLLSVILHALHSISRRKAEAVKRRGAESVRAGRRESKGNVHSPEFIAQGQVPYMPSCNICLSFN